MVHITSCCFFVVFSKITNHVLAYISFTVSFLWLCLGVGGVGGVGGVQPLGVGGEFSLRVGGGGGGGEFSL